MVDIVDQARRSRMMSGIRSKNTSPELQVRRFLHAKGFRYALHKSGMPGKPDIFLAKYSCAIFVNGCFWHGHEGCNFFRVPATRSDFWLSKIEANRRRDSLAVSALAAAGIRVAIVWECALKKNPEFSLSRLVQFLRSEERMLDLSAFQDARTE